MPDAPRMLRRYWWSIVLFEPGAGWLRWKPDWREQTYYDPPDHEEWRVYPPVHRSAFAVRAWLTHPWYALRGRVRWSEIPSRHDTDVLVDADRYRLYARGF